METDFYQIGKILRCLKKMDFEDGVKYEMFYNPETKSIGKMKTFKNKNPRKNLKTFVQILERNAVSIYL